MKYLQAGAVVDTGNKYRVEPGCVERAQMPAHFSHSE
jgi:hypothetical protein